MRRMLFLFVYGIVHSDLKAFIPIIAILFLLVYSFIFFVFWRRVYAVDSSQGVIGSQFLYFFFVLHVPSVLPLYIP